MPERANKHLRATLLALACAVAALVALPGAALAAKQDVVYTSTNSPGGNAVQVFTGGAGGSLDPAGSFPTGGTGTGGGLGSQGSVVLSDNGRFLFVVNAGSNQVSAFAARGDALELIGTVPSGGATPTSVTVSGRIVYVLNTGGAGNITGFTFDREDGLEPIPGSTRPLSAAGGTAPAQVSFDPSGRVLVVTERATNVIDTYTVDRHGRASGPNPQASAGATPFGFAFDKRGRLLVSEAFGGAPGASALSSYDLWGRSGVLSLITGSAATHQTAACWVVTTRNGRYAYVTNTGSASVSGYSIARDGSLALLTPGGITGVTGGGPIDMALSRDSHDLYTLDGAAHGLSSFRVQADGSLVAQPGAGGLPAGTVGLAAR